MDNTQQSRPDGGARSVSDARNHFNQLVDAADREGAISYITRGSGEPVAAIVPADVAQQHEQREDEYWSQQARAVLAAEDPDEALPLEKVIAALERSDQPPASAEAG